MTYWKFLALSAILAPGIHAATLSVGTASGSAGQQITLNVTLQTQGSQIAGLQFDLSYDKTVLSATAAAGTAASAAGKSVSTNSPDSGIRVLIVGFNQTLIGDGAVAIITINVAPNAPAGTYPLTFSGVSGSDPSGEPITTINRTNGSVVLGGGSVAPSLTVVKTHNGTFVPGQTGATYSVVVSNQSGTPPTSGPVTMTESIPAGLTLVSMMGTGWNCTGVVCTRGDPLSGGASYPAIAVIVNVGGNAPSTVVNQATVSGGGSASFSASDVATVTAMLQPQTLSFGPLNDVPVGAAPIALSATASSGLPVSFTSTTNPVCTVSGATITIVAAGTCSITASQAGNANFAAATPVTRTFSVLNGGNGVKGAQSVSFATLNDVVLGIGPIALNATASSGLAVVFTSSTLSVCVAIGNTLNVIAAGTCSVTASQPGDANYFAAPPVTQTFIVKRVDAPVVLQGGVVPVYSKSTSVQSGSWISIYGTNLAASTVLWNQDFPTSLGGVSVTVNGKPGYLWFVSPTQINLQAPDDAATGSVNVVVTAPTGSFTANVTLAAASPSLSLLDATHIAALVFNIDGSYDVVGPVGRFPYATRPVAAGEAIAIYGVGFGPTDPAVKSGQPVTASAATVNPVTVTIGGVNAPVAYSGIVGAGLYQINVTVPGGVPSGDQSVVASVSGLRTALGPVVTVR